MASIRRQYEVLAVERQAVIKCSHTSRKLESGEDGLFGSCYMSVLASRSY